MLLSLSWFFASSSSQRAYLAEGWMESHRCPNHEHQLSSPRITELLQSIHRDQILSFFKSWLRRSTDKEYLCFDISSISSYGSNNAYVEYGYNRDGEHLSQINIALLSGMDNDIPFYYEILPGSLHDVSSLPTFLTMLGKLGMKRISLIRFLSLIITEHMRKILRETPIEPDKETSKNWLSRYSVAEVFNRLESFTEVPFKNTYKPIHPEKTKAQREIFTIFDLKV